MANRTKPSVCLTMIVKNEAPTIARALRSAMPLITHWVIVDTGSTDGTQAIVRETLKDIPGELHERPWRDFASNRNEALELSLGKADYSLTLDGDDEFVYPPKYEWPPLTADAYMMEVKDVGASYGRIHLFRPDSGLRYVGVLHEVLMAATPFETVRLPTIVYRRHPVGARSRDPEKFRKDVVILEAAVEAEPQNARYVFCLAQTYRDLPDPEKAIAWYEKRAGMGGWDEEVYYSLLEVAKHAARLERGDAEVFAAYVRAYEERPTRAEAPCYLAIYLRRHGRPRAAYPFARVAIETPRPLDNLYIDDAVYAWRSLDEFAITSYYVGRYADSAKATAQLLAGSALPAAERGRLEQNAELCRTKLADVRVPGAHPFKPKEKRGAGHKR